ncbi:TPA: TIGR00153 family protein [Methanosarcinaceae archaeon]|nr:TIGR00153 family protein [Methanosarcinaceae archaeon]
MPGEYQRTVIEVFGKPPFLPLEEHARKAQIAAGKLNEAVQAYFEGDMETLHRLCVEIDRTEEEADYIKQKIQASLSPSVKLPVDPKHLLDFLTEQDKIVNDARNAAYWMELREYEELAPEIKEGFLELASKTKETVETYYTLIEKLYKLVKLSFSRKQMNSAFEIVPEVDRLEHEVDRIESELTKLIFAEQEKLHGAGVCHLLELVEKIGDLADKAVRSADALQTMVIRR